MDEKVQSPALVMRVMKYAFVLSAFLFIYIAIKIPVQPHQPVSQPVDAAITAVGLACVLAGFFLPGMLFRAAKTAPQNNSAETELQQWMTKGILSLANFEACILFGLLLHFLGANIRLVELLFGAGIAAELIWSPGPPPGTETGEFPPN